MMVAGRDAITPKEDDLVVIKYRGKLPSSSTPFICKGWDGEGAPEKCRVKELTPKGLTEAVKAMKLGSKANITLTSEYDPSGWA
jgi:FKBP-type peptidyl-prolyl cis-trans isomerase